MGILSFLCVAGFIAKLFCVKIFTSALADTVIIINIKVLLGSSYAIKHGKLKIIRKSLLRIIYDFRICLFYV